MAFYIEYAYQQGKLLTLNVIFLSASYLLSAMDKTADPCTDFFQYACGDWNKKHVIPEDRTSISTFEVMADQLQVILKGTTGAHTREYVKIIKSNMSTKIV